MTRKLSRLREAMDRNNAQWLEQRYGDVADALRQDLEDGATAAEVSAVARELSGEQDWFAKKIISAARHIESTIVERV